MASGLRQSSEDLLGSYSLAFYSTGEPDGKWHPLKLKSNRAGVELLYRESYIADAPRTQPELWTDQEWRTAISSPLGSGAIRINAHTADAGAAGLKLEVQIEPAGISFHRDRDAMRARLELCVAELSVDGKAAFRKESTELALDDAKWKSVQQSGIPYGRTWKPMPGAARVRVIVRDTATGEYGTLDIPLAKR